MTLCFCHKVTVTSRRCQYAVARRLTRRQSLGRRQGLHGITVDPAWLLPAHSPWNRPAALPVILSPPNPKCTDRGTMPPKWLAGSQARSVKLFGRTERSYRVKTLLLDRLLRSAFLL